MSDVDDRLQEAESDESQHRETLGKEGDQKVQGAVVEIVQEAEITAESDHDQVTDITEEDPALEVPL